MTLRARYTLVLTALASALIVTVGAALLMQFHISSVLATDAATDAFERTLRAEYEQRGVMLTQILASGLVHPLYRNDMQRVHSLLREVRKDPDVAQVLVFDEQGRIAHDGTDGLTRFGMPMSGPRGERAALADALLIQEADVGLDITQPIRLGDTPIGGVRLVLSLERMAGEVAAQRAEIASSHAVGFHRRLAIIVVGLMTGLICSGVIAATLARRLTRPVEQLVQAARDISQDRDATTDELDGDNVFGKLARALHDMQAQLRQTTIPRANLARVMGSLNEALLTTDETGDICLANAAAARQFGRSPEELSGKSIADLFEGTARPTLADVASHGGEVAHFPACQLRRADGSAVPVAVAAMALAGNRPSFAFVVQDLREHLDREREQRLAGSVFSHSSEGIVVTDATGRVLQVNPAFQHVTGLQADEVRGRTLASLEAKTVEGNDLGVVVDTLAREGRWEGEIWYQRVGGGASPLWLSALSILDTQGRVEHYTAAFVDLRALKDAEKRIHHLAYFDSLTNLPNRMLFQDRLQQSIAQAQRHGELVALLFIDLDRFKVINDTKGHAMGDLLLKHVAQRLRAAMRDEDTVSRIGGDEFAIIVPGLRGPEHATFVAQKVLGLFTPPFAIAGEDFFTAASIGLSLFPIDARDTETLVANADAAMFRAKEHGRSVYRFFTPDMNDRVAEAMEIEHGLRQALERDELTLQYQPQFDLRSGMPTGVEALLRWTNKRLGQVPPTVFIPVAEDCGLIGVIGEWMIREACRQASDWRDRGFGPIRMAVNLSGRQFSDPRLLAQIEGALAASDLDPRSLEVEITETVVMTDLDRSIATLMRLNDIGVRIAVDDFGTGYSSLSYLKRFPLHALKIDRSFIRDVMDDPDDAAITSAIINMAHSLGLTVIAEGVENSDHEAFLRAHNCDIAQGYFYGRAVSAGEIVKLLSRSALPVTAP